MIPEWLKELVTLKVFPSLKSVKFNISLFKNASFIKVVNKPQIDNRSINGLPPIIWSQLTSSQKKSVKSAIHKNFGEGGEVLEAEYVDGVEDYVEKEKKSDEGDLIEFFRGKIPEEDLYILKASSYIQKVFDEGNKVHELTKQLRYKYGQRGVNICHLYSADYFRTWIKPLYENSKNQENFNKAYELAIQQSPFAIFVNSDMKVSDIEKITRSKIKESKLYGIKVINVHGIGSDNIDKIVKAMGIINKEFDNLEVSYEPLVMFVAKIKLLDKKK